MARINVTQNINLTVMVDKDGKLTQQSFALLRTQLNEIPNELLAHPYLQAHMKAGSLSIVPDPMDPEDIAAAAEEIARRARAEADAAKALREAKQKEIDDALAAASKPASPEPTAADKTAAEEAEFQRLLEAEAAAAGNPQPAA